MRRRPDLYETWCRAHPLAPGRWKRSERAVLVRKEEDWRAAAAIYAAGWQQLCAEVCTQEYLAQHTPDYMQAKLAEDPRGGPGRCTCTARPGRRMPLSAFVTKPVKSAGFMWRPKRRAGDLAQMLDFARKKLAEHPQPFLSVLDTNQRAIALYLRMGFRPAGVIAVYDPLKPTVPAVIAEK